jgi:hypothetical protein
MITTHSVSSLYHHARHSGIRVAYTHLQYEAFLLVWTSFSRSRCSVLWLRIFISAVRTPSMANHISIYGSTALVDLGRFFSFLIHTQSVGLFGGGISPSQGRYLHTKQHKPTINSHRNPCLEWDSNPWCQCSSGRRGSYLRPRGHCDRLRLIINHYC